MHITSKIITSTALKIKISQIKRQNVSIFAHKDESGRFKVALFGVKNNVDVFLNNKYLYDSHHLRYSYKKKTSKVSYENSVLSMPFVKYEGFEFSRIKSSIFNGDIFEINTGDSIITIKVIDFYGRVKVKVEGTTDIFIDEVLHYEYEYDDISGYKDIRIAQ